MKQRKLFRSWLFAVMACLILLNACKPKPRESTENESPQAPSHSDEPFGKEYPEFEPDPALRPVITSEPASDQRDWAYRALLQGYRASGHTSQEWDQQVDAIFGAFAEYTRVNATAWDKLHAALTDIQRTGCDDPMIQYLKARYLDHPSDKQATAREFAQAHDAMLRSKHHPLFKFMAGLRAVEHIRAADRKANPSQRIIWTTANLVDTARDTNAPPAELQEVTTFWVRLRSDEAWVAYVRGHLDPYLPSDWASPEFWPLIYGKAAIQAAWRDRGGGYANTVTTKGWEGFSENLDKAEEFLTEAWTKNHSNAEIAYLMMKVELGQGRGRPRMEHWFNRAMNLETNYYDAASLMAFYLEPRWYGSEADTLRFCRSCVASTNWGGTVPTVLAKTHRSLAKYYYGTNTADYWQRPQVWRDVKASWERFFELNPGAYGWRHDYARDAFECGQYTVFLQQTKRFEGGTNYSFFGGESAYNEMVAKAQSASVGQNDSN